MPHAVSTIFFSFLSNTSYQVLYQVPHLAVATSSKQRRSLKIKISRRCLGVQPYPELRPPMAVNGKTIVTHEDKD